MALLVDQPLTCCSESVVLSLVSADNNNNNNNNNGGSRGGNNNNNNNGGNGGSALFYCLPTCDILPQSARGMLGPALLASQGCLEDLFISSTAACF